MPQLEIYLKNLSFLKFCRLFIVAFNGEKYALSITDWEKARNFLNTEGAFFDGTTWKEDSEIGKAFKKATRFFKDKYDGNENQKNITYEMAMSAVMNQYNAGVTLNKKDASDNFKPIVIKTYPDLRKPKKTIYTQDCMLYTQYRVVGWNPTIASFYANAMVGDIKILE